MLAAVMVSALLAGPSIAAGVGECIGETRFSALQYPAGKLKDASMFKFDDSNGGCTQITTVKPDPVNHEEV
jgi:hypothetical protein